MPRPDFTDEEQYLIDVVKSKMASEGQLSASIGMVVSTGVLAAFGFYHRNVEMVLGAFIVLVGYQIYVELTQARVTPQWRNIITKYESACDDETDAHETDAE